MSADTITALNFILHSLIIGAAFWLVVRFIIRDALRRCILANLAVLMCLFSPQNISFQDLLPAPAPASVLTPIQNTFKADWRITVTPSTAPSPAIPTTQAPSWNINETVKALSRLSWFVTAALLLRLALQCIGVQRWAWRLRRPSINESDKLPDDFDPTRIRVVDHAATPCVAGWFFPVIAVPASAFEKLTPHQWRWLLRHEGEHLRIHDTVVVFLQNIVRAILWWNPFAHALIEEYARAREEACDAAAVGEERDHSAYADFLLTWAAQSLPQSGCVMPISHSLPARRLKLRLVALMEARGVRKKLGALFVLASAAFFLIVPMVAASFGITAASAQDAPKPQPDDGTLNTRVYKVSPDFLTSPVVAQTARELLEQKGVSFPPGASAIYQPATSQLIVRNTRANIQVIESIIDQLHTIPAMVLCTCKLIQANEFIGEHESILSQKEADALIRSAMQQKGTDVLSAPSVTMKFDQRAAMEVGREVMPKVLPDGKLSGGMKFVGPSIKLMASSPVQGKTTLEAKVDLGLDLDSATPWLPSKDKVADWDHVLIFSVASQAALASGETLLLHLKTAKKPVTVLITANALKPDGQNAGSFTATTLKAPPSSQGRDMPAEDKKQQEWAVREYRVPSDFGNGEQPMAYLEAKGVVFPSGAKAELKDGKLIVRNTQGNLDLIEALVLMHHAETLKNEGRIRIAVHAVDVKIDKDGLMKQIIMKQIINPLLQDLASQPARAAHSLSNIDEALARETISQLMTAGILTDSQSRSAIEKLTQSGFKPVSLPNMAVKSGKEAVFDMPKEVGAGVIKVTPDIGMDGNAVELLINVTTSGHTAKRVITTGVWIWDGQTVIMAQPAGTDKTMRVIFITATILDPLGNPVKK